MVESIELFSGLVGAVIGGVMALLGTWLTLRSQGKQEEHEERARVSAVLEAIHTEIRTIYQLYRETMTVRVEYLPEGNPLEVHYPIRQDYFTLFTQNAGSIGRISNSELRTAIVRCYALTKSLVDTYGFNNDLYDAWLAADMQHKRHGNPADAQDAKLRRAAMVDYVPHIRKAHDDALESYRQLDVMLTAIGATQCRIATAATKGKVDADILRGRCNHLCVTQGAKMSISPTENEKAAAVVICRAAAFSVAKEAGQFSGWVTGGCAAAFALVLSNPDRVTFAVGSGVLPLLKILGAGIMLGFWVKYRLISHNAARDAYDQAIKTFGNEMPSHVDPLPQGVQLAIVQIMPWHLRRRIRRVLEKPLDIASRDTLIRAVEWTKVLCMGQAVAVVACVVYVIATA